MRTHHLMTAVAGLAALIAAGSGCAFAQARTTLDIYVVDVEGGNATLFVAPSGQSLLIDTGNYGPEASVRDAERIMAAAKDAGLTQIDHLITTHWHGDHFGGMAELAKRIPIREFIDHGPNVQPAPAVDDFLQNVYPKLYANAKHTVAKVGDKIAVAGLDVTVVTSAGETLKTALPGAGAPNPYCANFKPGDNNAEDPMSVGTYITFGKFRTMHLGDVTKNKEFELMCPVNRIGTLDVFLGLHHAVNSSSSEVIVHALRPRVVIINNGTRKGGQPDVMQVLSLLARPRRPLADSFLAIERPGIHGARHVHREPARPAVGGDAGGADRSADARPEHTASAGPQRPGLLDQAVGKDGRLLHRHQCAERIHQDLRRAQAGHVIGHAVIPGRALARTRNPGACSRHSGFRVPPVGPAKGRTRWAAPE